MHMLMQQLQSVCYVLSVASLECGIRIWKMLIDGIAGVAIALLLADIDEVWQA